MCVAISSMANHTLRLRTTETVAPPFFRGVNTPAIKNKRPAWKCYDVV